MPLSDRRRAQLLAGPYTRLLAEHEGAMSDFYGVCATLLRDAEQFWRTLAEEELGHQEIVTTLHEKLHQGALKFKRPRFAASAILDSLDVIAQRKKQMQTHGISMREALRLAVDFETGMLETGFFNIADGDAPETMEVLLQQAAYTGNHIKRLQKEARRLKWRLVGARKFRFLHGGALSGEELRATVRTTQGAMLGLLVTLEETISHLYNAYSERLPESRAFWSRVAAEEMQHAAMIRQLYKVLEHGRLFYNIDTFNRRALESEIDLVLNAEFEARHGRLSYYSAINMALKIERFLLERDFYKTAKSDAPDFRLVANRMTENIRIHIRKMEDEAGRVIDMGALARENVPLHGQ
ncbi:MAG: hypothetical protein C0404_07920 [Verrucomicrobia bacterium]|nr:hypothetical protein [Verrucomicrobiota bacterium]